MNVSGRWRHLVSAVLWISYGIVWIGGVGGHFLFGGTPANMTWPAPVFLLIASLVVLNSAKQDWKALLITLAVGFLAEAVGVATGYPFGRYSYTVVLAPQLLGVPLVMAGAWMILTAWVRQLQVLPWIGALLLVAVDLLIDPLASGALGFWRWKGSGPYYGIPAVNFLGWFVVSWVILILLRKPPARNAEVFIIGTSILLFFILIGLAHAFFVPSSVGLLLCGFGYWRWRSSIVSTRI